MKVLYAIQGTGNGHISRAKEVIPALMNRVKVDVLVSGTQAEVVLPFEVKYKLNGMGFDFGKNGGINFYTTFKKNSIFRFFKEVKNCPVEDYDLVINDFEPVTAWACKWRNVNCISFSHQSALLSPNVPKPSYKDYLSSLVLKYYAPSIQNFGLHFKSYNNSISLPIIRKSIRDLKVTQENHYTVYLPAYADEKIISILAEVPNTHWHVFSKKCQSAYHKKKIKVFPIESNQFEASLASCIGVVCGAGFETPAETLYLKKKLLVIPMVGQYEQQYNAASLQDIGVPVLKKLKKKHLPKIINWVENGTTVAVNYPDKTQNIVDDFLSKYIIATELSNKLLKEVFTNS